RGGVVHADFGGVPAGHALPSLERAVGVGGQEVVEQVGALRGFFGVFDPCGVVGPHEQVGPQSGVGELCCKVGGGLGVVVCTSMTTSYRGICFSGGMHGFEDTNAHDLGLGAHRNPDTRA